jgi:hypothetical protein
MEVLIQVGGAKQPDVVSRTYRPALYIPAAPNSQADSETDKFTSNPDSQAPTTARLRSIRTCNRRPGTHNLVDLKTENRNDAHRISPPQSYLI